MFDVVVTTGWQEVQPPVDGFPSPLACGIRSRLLCSKAYRQGSRSKECGRETDEEEMMILGEKIAQLRKKNGWSQEELAGKLNVSRQSVSKWESAMSVPDLDKIVLMSGLFEVSTDYLLKDELTEEEFVSGNPDGEQMRRISMEEAQRFLKVRREASGRIASGVAACILSPAALLFLSEAAEYGLLDLSKELADGIGMMILLLIVAGAVASFLIFGREMGRYEYLEKEIFELSYGVEGMVREKSEAYAPVFGTKMAGGVALCILGFIPLILSEGLWGTGMAEVLCFIFLLTCVAAAVWLFVSAGIIHGAYIQLLQEGDYTVEKKSTGKFLDRIAPVYWCVVTAGYVGYSLWSWNWGTSWIVWPVAGILYGALAGVVGIWKKC